MAIFNSSGKLPVFNTWLINKVSGLIIAGSMILINFEEIPSSPQLFFEERFLYRLPNRFFINVLKIKYCIYNVYLNNTSNFQCRRI